MKNVLKGVLVLLVAAGLVFGLASCGGGGGNSPEAVVRAFYAAVGKGDTKAMEKTATPETVALIGMFGEKAKEGVEEQGKITKAEQEIDGDEATVKLTFENGKTTDVDLIKVKGKWMVNVSK